MSQKSALQIRVLELYRANQILWNPHCSAYRNHLFRQKAWEKCASQLQMTTRGFKKMVTSLRSYYNRIRKSPNFSADASPEWVQLAHSFLSQSSDHTDEPFDLEQFVQEIEMDTIESGCEFEPINFPASKRRMTAEIAHRLMLLYKELPVLWQPDHPHYNVVFHRNHAWQRISKCVNVGGLTPSECKKEVHQIRSRYVLKRKNMTDQEIKDHNLDWFQLAHSFLDTVLFERDTDGDLVLVNVRQGQKKYKPKNVVAITKSVFLNESEPEEEMILKCRLCLTRLESKDGSNFAEGDPLFTLYIELIGLSPLATGPDSICTSCEAKLLTFSQFRSKCRENEEALIVASTQKIDEAAHLLQIETLEVEKDEPTLVQELAADPTRISCELCMKDFISQYNLNTHLRNIHGIERIEVDDESTPLAREKKTTANICPECGKMVVSIASHMKTHRPPNLYRCEPCGKAYKNQRNLRVHHRSVHEGYALTCNYCPAKFRSWSGRQDHYLMKHSAASVQFQCAFCSRYFPATRILNRHIRQLHSPKTHKCGQCESVFTRSTNLRAHVDAKHTGGLEQLPCAVCEKRFASKKLLQQHVVAHTGEKNYPCPVCQAKFSRNHVLRTHIQQLHKNYHMPPKGTLTSVRALQRVAQQVM